MSDPTPTPADSVPELEDRVAALERRCDELLTAIARLRGGTELWDRQLLSQPGGIPGLSP